MACKNYFDLVLKVIKSGKVCQIGYQNWNVRYFQRERPNQTKLPNEIMGTNLDDIDSASSYFTTEGTLLNLQLAA